MIYRSYDINKQTPCYVISKDGKVCAHATTEDEAMNWVDGELRRLRLAKAEG